MRPALLICNPRSGGRDRQRDLPRLQRLLAGAGFETELRSTEGPGDATRIAEETVAAGAIEAVFGLGGDGTLREIAIGLLGSRLPLGVLPGGTTNVLATCLGLPGDAVAAGEALAAGEPEVVDFDVGLCGSEPFLMMVSAGIDAVVLARASQTAKKRWGRLAVGSQALSALRDYDFPRYTLSSRGHREAGSFAIVSNVPFYGGAFRMTPMASFQDGILDLGIFRGTGPRATLGFALDVARGRHPRRDDVELWQARMARLDGDGRARLQIDGDPVEIELPVDFSISPDRLRILLPRER
ncbi:MAG: diacylglycerol kinase family lipid kinase [Thermoanaerobaculia bacterium]|nr:diacylglycerol kinase family lipid kinase [Thermoanaerobaculia bacterium]